MSVTIARPRSKLSVRTSTPLPARSVAEAAQVLARAERDPAVTVVHAHGLTLEEVGYPSDADLAIQAEGARRVRTLPGQQRYDEPGGGLARTGEPRG